MAAADPQGSRSFWNHTVQPESGLIANYYGLPSISMVIICVLTPCG